MTKVRLADIFRNSSLSEIVHLCVDLQKSYIGENEKGIEKLITKTVAPELLASGIPTFWIYYEVSTPSAFRVGGHKARPQSSRDDLSDMIGRRAGYLYLPKFETSAMSSEDVQNALQDNDKKILIISGLTYGVCIADTIIDAIKQGSKVILMVDGTDYDDCFDILETQLKNLGAVFSTSSEILGAVNEVFPKEERLPALSL
jgi:nicotinamidase-related amidase